MVEFLGPAWLDVEIYNNQTVLEWLDYFATYWEHLLSPSPSATMQDGGCRNISGDYLG